MAMSVLGRTVCQEAELSAGTRLGKRRPDRRRPGEGRNGWPGRVCIVPADHGLPGKLTWVGYTYGKSLDQASNLGEQLYPYNYGLTCAPFLIRYSAQFRGELSLRTAGTDCCKHSNRATSGWAISGITRFSSGLLITLINPNDTSDRKLQQRSERRWVFELGDRAGASATQPQPTEWTAIFRPGGV